jgi:hypothetical protein
MVLQSKKGGLVYCGSVLMFTSHVLHYCSTADHPYQFFITAAVTFWYGYQPHTTFSYVVPLMTAS